MEEFSTSLVREKITFIDAIPRADDSAEQLPTVIRSNRIFLKLGDKSATEKIVVRAQNMHTTLRLANRVMTSYFHNGLFLQRSQPVEWEKMWDSVLSNYEKEFNPDIWGAVYINSKPVLKTTTSAFMDVIEKCALLTTDNYDATMEVTESVLKQIGHQMTINHASNVAATFLDNGAFMHCGIMHRADGRDTTFSFNAHGGEMSHRVINSLGVASVFIEGINLRMMINSLNQKIRRGEIEKTGHETAQLRGASMRMAAINKGINHFEESFDVKYRPDKPNLFGMGA